VGDVVEGGTAVTGNCGSKPFSLQSRLQKSGNCFVILYN
jgi:hypothetical protein